MNYDKHVGYPGMVCLLDKKFYQSRRLNRRLSFYFVCPLTATEWNCTIEISSFFCSVTTEIQILQLSLQTRVALQDFELGFFCSF